MEVFSPIKNLYTTLNQLNPEIRLLKLNTADDEDQPISCTLSSINLSEDVPYFIAFSYVWGSETEVKPISVNGTSFQATRNLCHLLRAVRKKARTEPNINNKFLWIDALCINQADLQERNNQVLLMNRIYREATFVIAWLGDESDDSSLGFQVLKLSGSERKAGTSIFSVWWLELHIELLCTAEPEADESDDDDDDHDRDLDGEQKDTEEDAKKDASPWNPAWRSVFGLMRRQYWKRVWTFQEIVLPCTVYLMCGQDSCLLEDLIWLYEWLLSCRQDSRPSCMDPDIWDLLCSSQYIKTFGGFDPMTGIYNTRQELHVHSEQRRSFETELADFGSLRGTTVESDYQFETIPSIWCHSKARGLKIEQEPLAWQIAPTLINRHASNQRDKIYGFLGVAGLQLVPDYGKPVREVFIEFARTGLKSNVDMVMKYSRWIDPQSQASPDLPSWVPSWSVSGGRMTIPGSTNFHNASTCVDSDGDTIHNLFSEPYIKDDSLFICGISCDTISYVGDPIHKDNIFKTVSDYVQKAPETPYLTGIPRLQAIMRVLLQDRDFEDTRALVAGGGKLQRHAWAFLSWLTGHHHGSLAQFTDPLGLSGLSDYKNRNSTFKSRILGDLKDGEFTNRFKTIHEALDPAQWLYVEIDSRMRMNEKYRIFETEGGYLGIGPKSMQRGDVVCVLFNCRSPVILRCVGSYYVHLGPCFTLGLMEGEAIREYSRGLKSKTEFEIR